MNRAELKSDAKLKLKGKYGVLFVITLIISLISSVAGAILGFIPYVGSLISTIIVTPAFALSMVRVYLAVSAGETPDVKDAFSGFDDFWSAFKVTFLVGLYTFLWSLLFVIPGIVKTYAYSMSMFVLAENKGKGARECIKESMALTNGHKMELFVLGLSFIGWILLGMLSLGIGFIWILPYMEATYANFYKKLKPQQPELPEAAAEESDAPAEESFTAVNTEE